MQRKAASDCRRASSAAAVSRGYISQPGKLQISSVSTVHQRLFNQKPNCGSRRICCVKKLIEGEESTRATLRRGSSPHTTGYHRAHQGRDGGRLLVDAEVKHGVRRRSSSCADIDNQSAIHNGCSFSHGSLRTGQSTLVDFRCLRCVPVAQNRSASVGPKTNQSGSAKNTTSRNVATETKDDAPLGLERRLSRLEQIYVSQEEAIQVRIQTEVTRRIFVVEIILPKHHGPD
ncbi:hypothetical protein TGFOU_314485 [Toxoplasma gondii FOU]|uniref:Uncharacterized protein n=3 Tax=Toxoplasma gondii TaxID=5811 RepID=A0A086LHX7_TOXGO|nr:hypothetical protein TGFOU_314485 [Toxoplasma gondii FOU]PUA91481.1 hypothetical protein TGBR9_314485 [Toxoplasma gondii TgCATBr9]RQX71006.1 hypothetical protein TGCAST_314485 [Toxoplasma gondii CAST]